MIMYVVAKAKAAKLLEQIIQEIVNLSEVFSVGCHLIRKEHMEHAEHVI